MDNPEHDDVKDATALMRLYPKDHAMWANLQAARDAAVEAMNNRP
jgi:hypothetical protein